LADWAEQHGRIVVSVFVAVNVLLCLALFDPKLHTGGDSSSYVLLAESVMRFGDGYAQALWPGPAQAHTQYPPGYPLMLGPLVLVAGRNFVVLKMLSVLFCAASVFLFALFVRKRSAPRRWLYLAGAFAVNPLVVDYSRWMLSEAPFLLWTLLALRFFQDDEPDDMGRPFWFALLASVAAYYVRSIGVMLVAGASLAYMMRREWKKFLVHGVVSATLTLPWLIRNKVVGGASTPYVDQFLLRSVYDPEAGYLGFWGMVERFFTNVRIYSARELPRALVGSDSSWAATGLLKALAIAICVFLVVGFIRAVRRRVEAAEVYFALSCLAVLLFEEVVSDVRYLLPLIPLILVYAEEGLSTAVAFLRPAAERSRIPALALSVVAAVGLLAQMQRVPQNMERTDGCSSTRLPRTRTPSWLPSSLPTTSSSTRSAARPFGTWCRRSSRNRHALRRCFAVRSPRPGFYRCRGRWSVRGARREGPYRLAFVFDAHPVARRRRAVEHRQRDAEYDVLDIGPIMPIKILEKMPHEGKPRLGCPPAQEVRNPAHRVDRVFGGTVESPSYDGRAGQARLHDAPVHEALAGPHHQPICHVPVEGRRSQPLAVDQRSDHLDEKGGRGTRDAGPDQPSEPAALTGLPGVQYLFGQGGGARGNQFVGGRPVHRLPGSLGGFLFRRLDPVRETRQGSSACLGRPGLLQSEADLVPETLLVRHRP
jgi:4-amino-4-deoxy-L-arabinose transferase-like glycosyltransferase